MAAKVEDRINRIRQGIASDDHEHACVTALAVLADTSGHRGVSAVLGDAISSGNWMKQKAAAQVVVDLFDDGVLTSPVLKIAHEIEGGVLDIADSQVRAADRTADAASKAMSLAIAAFLAGAALEDCLRRLCDSHGLQYDAQATSLSKLQAVLYQPSKNVEVITLGEVKQITAWGDSRNKADHGKFNELTHTDVLTMTLGVRAFIDKYLP